MRCRARRVKERNGDRGVEGEGNKSQREEKGKESATVNEEVNETERRMEQDTREWKRKLGEGRERKAGEWKRK